MKPKYLPHVLRGYPYCLIIFLLISTSAIAQSYNDSSLRKNIIKYDITSNILFNSSYNFTYERVLRKQQTLGITLGYQELPTLQSLLANDTVTTTRKTASGYKFAADYRFYLGKENRYQGPHGVYIGPYMAYHSFDNDWDLTIQSSSGTQTGSVGAKLQVLNIGFQAGYQFLINNRWSIDMSFIGGSVSHYRARMDVNGDFDLDDSEINQDLLDALVDKFPLFGDLIDDGEVDQSGKRDNWGMGYRYIVNVGYAFGGSPKKKAKSL
jgi:hypothetical protein